MNTLLLALVSIVISVAAQFALKWGMSTPAVKFALSQPLSPSTAFAVASSPLVILGLFAYAVGAVIWLGVLAHWDVSKAYPLVGLGFALAVLAGAIVGEQVSGQRMLGILLIVTGAFFVGRS
jgi:multidrug transporter EmrE-like cation transporter